MNIIKLSINRPVTVLMFYLLIIMTGVISFLRLPIDFLPNIGYPQLTIITIYENSSPQEVEKLITKPIEDVVSTLKGVKKVTSVSRDDVSVITLKYNWGTDMSYASLNLREQLDNLRYSFPEDAERPNIAKLDPTEEPVMFISLSSKTTDNLIKIQNLAEDLIKRRLQQIEGVASANIIGNLEELIEIKLNKDKINALGLDLNSIENKIKYSNFNTPGGTIKEGHYKLNLKIIGEFQTLKDIENTPLLYSKNGSVILLKDIAEVIATYKDEKSITRLNSKRSLGILIRKEANENTVKVCKNVKEYLKQLRKEYPDLEFFVATDQSKFINESILSVLEAILIGGFLAFLILFLFLKDLRSPFNISIVIPISILVTFILMYFNKITLNIISLSGIALGVGMLVDNSIVVSENIFRHRSEGKNWKDAAFEGTKEVSLAIIASTLTTLAVFLPIIYVKGIAASLFKQQAMTVTYSLLSSLLVSLTILPLLASLRHKESKEKLRKIKVKKEHKKIVKILLVILKILVFPFKVIYLCIKFLFKIINFIFSAILKAIGSIIRLISNGFQKQFDKFTAVYLSFLNFSLNHKFIILFLFGLIFIGSIFMLHFPDKEFFPEIEQSQFTILLKLDPGTPLELTDRMILSIEEKLKIDNRISSYFTSVGKSNEDKLSYFLQNSSSENLAEIKVNLKKDYKSDDVIATYRDFLKDKPAIITFKKGDNILVSLLEFEEPGLSVVIYGEDLEKMRTKADLIKAQISENPNYYDIRADYEVEKPMIELTVNRSAIAMYNIPVNRISKFIKTNISGDKISDFRKFNKKIDISLKIDTEDDLVNLLDKHLIYDNKKIPIRALVDVKRIQTFDEIKRSDQSRKFTISFSFAGKVENTVADLEKIIDKADDKSSGERFSIDGINKEISGSLKSLMYALIFAIVLVYMILASQFESFKLPFIIIFVAPMGVIGVSLGLILTNVSISIMSTLGMIVLSGIIVNDAILLVDYTKQLQKRQVPKLEAIQTAARTRLRPILMTTFTTVFGLLPLAFGIGSGAELQSPMAVAVIGGMLSATFLTLILIPVLYSLFES